MVWAAPHMFVHCEGGINKIRDGSINGPTAVHMMVAKCTERSAHVCLLLSVVQEQRAYTRALICGYNVQQTQTPVPLRRSNPEVRHSYLDTHTHTPRQATSYYAQPKLR